MKFTINTSTLLQILATVSKAVPQKGLTPAGECFLVNVGAGSLVVTATNLESSLVYSLKEEGSGALEVSGDGAFCVPARIFSALVRAVSSETVSVSCERADRVDVSWGGGESSLPAFPVADFPAVEFPEWGTAVAFPARELADAVESVAYAAAVDPLRPVMECVLVDLRPDGTTVAATDTRILVCRDVPSVLVPEERACQVLIHGRCMSVLKGVIAKNAEEIVLETSADKVSFTCGNLRAVFRRVAGKFPAYRSVIPPGGTTLVSVHRETLVSALRLAGLFTDGRSGYVKIGVGVDPEGGTLQVDAQDVGFGVSSTETVAAAGASGEPLQVGFKAARLTEMLTHFSCSTLEIAFNGSRRAALVRPSQEERADEPAYGIIMPVQVS